MIYDTYGYYLLAKGDYNGARSILDSALTICDEFAIHTMVPAVSAKLESAGNIPTLIQLTTALLIQIRGIDQVIFLILDKSRNNLVVRLEKGKAELKLLNNSSIQYGIALLLRRGKFFSHVLTI